MGVINSKCLKNTPVERADMMHNTLTQERLKIMCHVEKQGNSLPKIPQLLDSSACMITKMTIRRTKLEGKNAAIITRLGSAALKSGLPRMVRGLIGARAISKKKTM